MSELIEKAKQVLKENDRGKMTIPSAHLYPHMWAWDSVFAAMGWAHIDMDRAFEELKYQIDSAWDNGMIPHIVFDQDHLKDYFPGPDVWGHPTGTTITQPPVWAIGLEYLLSQGLDPEKVKDLIAALEKTHLFFYQNRDPENLNLVAVCHPWESGMDNSPAWDIPLKKVTENSRFKLNRVDTLKVENPNERPTDIEYRRYLKIVESLQDNNFTPTEFLVYDPFMSTMLYLSELALHRVCNQLNIETQSLERAQKIKESLLDFYHPESGRFLYRDVINNKNYSCSSLASLFPLLIKDLPLQIQQKGLNTLKQDHLCQYGLTTQAKQDKSFDSVCYWRGPIWINTNYFFTDILPKEMITSTENLIKTSGFREYYSPLDGQGLGATNFSWTAALYLVMQSRRIN